MQKQNDSQKKPSRKKYIIPTIIIFLCILAGYIYMIVTWTKASEAIIRQTIAEQLNKDQNDLTDEDFMEVTEITISQKELSDIKPLEKLSNLQILELNTVAVRNIKPLSGLVNLKRMSLINTQVSNLQPIKGLAHLQSLRLVDSQVSDLEPLKGLTNLQNLYLSLTQVSDLEPIKGLKNLVELWLEHCNNITDQQVEDLQKALPKLTISR